MRYLEGSLRTVTLVGSSGCSPLAGSGVDKIGRVPSGTSTAVTLGVPWGWSHMVVAWRGPLARFHCRGSSTGVPWRGPPADPI